MPLNVVLRELILIKKLIAKARVIATSNEPKTMQGHLTHFFLKIRLRIMNMLVKIKKTKTFTTNCCDGTIGFELKPIVLFAV